MRTVHEYRIMPYAVIVVEVDSWRNRERLFLSKDIYRIECRIVAMNSQSNDIANQLLISFILNRQLRIFPT